ncbi:MAG: hypothetical protein AMXMBFR84_29080 [Candidatus Hydrogenedentota bacterium]
MQPYPILTRTGRKFPVNASVSMRFTADPALFSGVCLSCLEFATALHPANAPKVPIVLRELLTNALEHGSKNNPEKKIACRVTRIGDNAIEVVVEDEGNGFDFSELDLSAPSSPDEDWHRGLRLVHTLSDSLQFDAGGRRVTALLSWETERHGHFEVHSH